MNLDLRETAFMEQPAGLPGARLHPVVPGLPDRVAAAHPGPVPADAAKTPHGFIADDAFDGRHGILRNEKTREFPGPAGLPEPPPAACGNEIGKTFV